MITTPLRRKWEQLGLDRFPVERPDLLARLGVFGDIHRLTRWSISDTVTPVVDVTAIREQVGTFYADGVVAAGGAGAFSAVALAVTNVVGVNNIIAKPLMIAVNSIGAASRVAIGLRTNPFLGGVPLINAGSPLDGRRFGSTAFAVLLRSADVANVLNNPQMVFPAGTLIIGPDDGVLENLWVAANQQLVVADVVANEGFECTIVWTEEEQRPTRVRG